MSARRQFKEPVKGKAVVGWRHKRIAKHMSKDPEIGEPFIYRSSAVSAERLNGAIA